VLACELRVKFKISKSALEIPHGCQMKNIVRVHNVQKMKNDELQMNFVDERNAENS